MPDPTEIRLADRANEVAQLSQLVRAKWILDPAAQIIVEGAVQPNTWWVAADEIVFKPGGHLVFPEHVTKGSRELYIVAERITIEDPLSPALITWETTPPSPMPDRGQAPTGGAGSGDGAAGGRGADGAPGTTGGRGADAPNLTILLRTLAGGTLELLFEGAIGGPGGAGQRGGDGGAGARGSRARQARSSGPFGTTIWHPWCEAGPGWGGRGGDGGTGGQGGTGGPGGRGGSITIVSIPEALPILTNALRRRVKGGDGGAGGTGGTGGNPGAGGPEGELANFCNSAGRNGAAGSPGAQGPQGVKGPDGEEGRTFVGSLSEKQFLDLFGF